MLLNTKSGVCPKIRNLHLWQDDWRLDGRRLLRAVAEGAEAEGGGGVDRAGRAGGLPVGGGRGGPLLDVWGPHR